MTRGEALSEMKGLLTAALLSAGALTPAFAQQGIVRAYEEFRNPEERFTHSSFPLVTPDTALVPSGISGGVEIL